MKKNIVKLIFGLFLGIIPVISLAQIYKEDTTIKKNLLLITEIEKYESYLKQLTLNYRIKDYIIKLLHEKNNDEDIFTISTLFYEPPEISSFNPTSFVIIDKIPVIIHDNFDGQAIKNEGLIKYLSDTYLIDNYDGFYHVRHNPTDTIPYRGEKIAEGEPLLSDAYKMKNVKITPRRWVITFQNNNIIKESIDKEELTPYRYH